MVDLHYLSENKPKLIKLIKKLSEKILQPRNQLFHQAYFKIPQVQWRDKIPTRDPILDTRVATTGEETKEVDTGAMDLLEGTEETSTKANMDKVVAAATEEADMRAMVVEAEEATEIGASRSMGALAREAGVTEVATAKVAASAEAVEIRAFSREATLPRSQAIHWSQFRPIQRKLKFKRFPSTRTSSG